MDAVIKEIAVRLRYGDVLHHRTRKNSDKTPLRCRVMGECKTWKTQPGRWQLPVKTGLRGSFYITAENAGEWVTT